MIIVAHHALQMEIPAGMVGNGMPRMHPKQPCTYLVHTVIALCAESSIDGRVQTEGGGKHLAKA